MRRSRSWVTGDKHRCSETIPPQTDVIGTPDGGFLMNRAFLAATAAAIGLVAGGIGLTQAVSASAPAGTTAATPQRVDDFELTDQTRLAHRLYYFGYAPAIVI